MLPYRALLPAVACLAMLGCEPGAGMWRAAADHVRERFEPGDLVVIAPAWQAGRKHHFEGMPVEATDRPTSLPLRDHDRLWLVTEGPIEGSGPSHAIGSLERRYGEPERQVLSFLTVRLFDLSKSSRRDVRYDFLQKVEDAEVVMDSAGGVTPCGPWQRGSGRKGTHCAWGADGWKYVGETSGAADGDVRPCIWAHPIESGTLRVSYPEVPDGRRITGSYAILDTGIHNKAGKMATLTVQVDGRRVGKVYVQRKAGWHPLKLSLPPAATPGATREVVFEVTTTGQHGRHFCFDARLEGEPAGARDDARGPAEAPDGVPDGADDLGDDGADDPG